MTVNVLKGGNRTKEKNLLMILYISEIMTNGDLSIGIVGVGSIG